MSKPYRDFEPKWYHGEVPPTSYRSIFKWGAPVKNQTAQGIAL